MKPMVSIIVPVYNAEKYLRRCVDSIVRQEYKDFELFLVNDGSTDSSGAICDEYAASDSRIHVIHKENTGVSDTRNLALDQAQGTYLQFLDSDDWITPDATRLLVRAATEHNCDMVIADFYRVVGERVSHKGDIEEDGVLTREEFSEHMMENPADFYYGVLWNKLYRRDIVEKYKLRMDSSINWCEDFLFNLEYIIHAQVFYALQAPIYYYVKTKGSLASQGSSISNTVRMKLMVFEYYNEFYKNVYDEKDYEKKRLMVYRFLIDAAGDGSVPPALLPGVSKLGNERTNVYSEAISGEGIVSETYRSRKLLEHYLEVVALRNGLSLHDISLLLCLSQAHTFASLKELADFAGMSKNTLSRTLQRLSAKDLVKVTDVREKVARTSAEKQTAKASRDDSGRAFEKPSRRLTKKYLKVELLPAADAILPDLATAQNDFDAARFDGFSEEDLVQYARLSEKIKENTQKILGH